MAISLGKRKVRDEEENGGSDDEEALRARFRRAFEAKFKPLPEDFTTKAESEEIEESEDEDDSELDESDWSGLSSNEEDGRVEIVDHGNTRKMIDENAFDLIERKSFMSSKPPTSSLATASRTAQSTTSAAAASTDPTEATNLAHDLALQRLLKESHLLDATTFASSTPDAASGGYGGKARLHATELRMRDLGAKTSLATQAKMPMAVRKGIARKAAERETSRRREAAESGVVLERPVATKGAGKEARGREGRRVRGVGAPSVGRMRGGLLQLSRRDVRDIEGTKGRGGGGRGRGRGRGRGGGRGKGGVLRGLKI